MENFVIELRDVSYTYPDGHEAVHEVNLKITRGERIVVLGANGAGKSTLLMLMNGLYAPTTGIVAVQGKPAVGEYARAVRLEVGLVFQDPDDQLFCPTLWDDVCFGPLSMGLSSEEVRTRSLEALKAMALEGYESRLPHHLSAGEKKRAAIATVLAMRPRILLMDEPTANLDPKGRLELMNLLKAVDDKHGLTLVTATHDVNFAPALADRACVLDDGRLVADDTVHSVFSNSNLMEETNLEPPIVTQLFRDTTLERRNRIRRIPLTVEEGRLELGKCQNGNR